MDVDDFHVRSRAAWIKAVEGACGPNVPDRAEWRDIRVMAAVLKRFMGQNANHAHLPTGGGMDFRSVALAPEDGCLRFEVGYGTVYLIKPARLLLEYIRERPAETFLMLEGERLRPAVQKDVEDIEEVLDLGDGTYVERRHWDAEHYGYDEDGDERPLSDQARLTVRILRGKVMLVCKGSLWNGSRIYDGEHGNLSPNEIREVIRRWVEAG